jgi:glucose-1-phosphate adenylyltransferase
MKNDVIGLLDCHYSPELRDLTATRPLASTSFLGRYAFADFALSNFCNSEISTVGILIKDHQRSMLKHLGSMNAWVSNTKIGHEVICYNEKGALNPSYNSDINNIRENDWVLYDSNASYLVFESAHIILDIDLRPILAEHIARKEAMTVVYKTIDDADKEFATSALLEIDDKGYLTSAKKNDGKQKKANASLEIWIVNRTVLADIIKRHGTVDATYGMKEMIAYLLKVAPFKIHTSRYEGYARCFDSVEHYVDYSFELLNLQVASQLFKPEWPIYTLTHDTPPALYGERAAVTNSFVANGCIIEGRVENSILSRNVKIGKLSSVKNTIILSNVSVGDEVTIVSAIIDKYSVITSRRSLVAKDGIIQYIKQGAII